jgi:signal peptidase I
MDDLVSGEMLLPPERHKRPNVIFQTVFWILIVLCILLTALNVYIRTRCTCVVVSGQSMMSTLKDKDVLFADVKETPKRGDIVIMDVTVYKGTPFQFSGNYIIKRAIAFEGESLYCENGIVYIRYAGENEYTELKEDYVTYSQNRDFDVVTVGEGEIFVMGDNRATSYDCRNVGCMKTENVVGVITEWSYHLRGLVKAWYNFVGGNELKTSE